MKMASGPATVAASVTGGPPNVRNTRQELEDYARQYEPLFYARGPPTISGGGAPPLPPGGGASLPQLQPPPSHNVHRMPVKKLVCAYNEQILRKSHLHPPPPNHVLPPNNGQIRPLQSASYARLHNFTRQSVIYVNIYP